MGAEECNGASMLFQDNHFEIAVPSSGNVRLQLMRLFQDGPGKYKQHFMLS